MIGQLCRSPFALALAQLLQRLTRRTVQPPPLARRQLPVERLQQYLDFASRFHHYSRANQFLIWLQRPTATWVPSYPHWQAEGYQVAKGEIGIRILAPSLRKRINKETGEEERVVVEHSAMALCEGTH